MRIVVAVAYILLLILVLCMPWLMNAAFEHFGVYKTFPSPIHTTPD